MPVGQGDGHHDPDWIWLSDTARSEWHRSAVFKTWELQATCLVVAQVALVHALLLDHEPGSHGASAMVLMVELNGLHD